MFCQDTDTEHCLIVGVALLMYTVGFSIGKITCTCSESTKSFFSEYSFLLIKGFKGFVDEKLRGWHYKSKSKCICTKRPDVCNNSWNDSFITIIASIMLLQGWRSLAFTVRTNRCLFRLSHARDTQGKQIMLTGITVYFTQKLSSWRLIVLWSHTWPGWQCKHNERDKFHTMLVFSLIEISVSQAVSHSHKGWFKYIVGFHRNYNCSLSIISITLLPERDITQRYSF